MHVVSQGIESVNGTSVTMGCTGPIIIDSDGVMVCGSQSVTSSSAYVANLVSLSFWAMGSALLYFFVGYQTYLIFFRACTGASSTSRNRVSQWI